MTAEEFVNVLVAECEADESTAFVDQIRRDARAKVQAGKGTVGTLTSSALNGKSFAQQVQFSALETLNCCTRALKIYLSDGENDDVVSATRADFREMTY